MDASQLLDTYFAALEEGDIDKVLSCYADDAQIWHNFDQVTMTPEQNGASLVRDFFAVFSTREYLEVRRYLLPTGAVQQHVLKLVRHDGKSISWPGCIVFELIGDKIKRLEEYVDLSSFLAAMS